MEDAGYETARLRGADALANAVTMLRQRGLTVFEICDTPPSRPLLPLPARAPTDAEHAASESAVLASLSGSFAAPGAATTTTAAATTATHSLRPAPPSQAPSPVIRARFCAENPPLEGTTGATHALRELAGPRDEAWVFTLPQPKISIKSLRAVREAVDARLSATPEAEHPPRLTVILLTRDKIRNVATQEFSATGYLLERFLFSELTYNVTRHFLVPPHRLCTPEEIAKLKRRFPKLALQARDDAISRFHGLVSGDVIIYQRTRVGVLGGPYWREVV